MIFTRAAITPAESAYNRIWVRFENLEPFKISFVSPAALSYIFLTEVDCEQFRSHDLQTIAYFDNNLKGRVVHSTNTVTEWSYATPDSIHEAYIERTCA